MSRIERCLEMLNHKQKKALIPFITAGFPALQDTVPLMNAMVEGGADIIEVGIPFSDPMADGPAIQAASEVALENGTTISNVFEIVSEFRRSNPSTPIVMMSYLNPIEAFGYEAFSAGAREAGVDGLIVVDLPPEAAVNVCDIFNRDEIDLIYLVAPTTSDYRIQMISTMAQGYLYYVSLKGVTGAGHLNVPEVREKVDTIKAISDLPIMVGFGISDGNTARAICEVSDGVIVGSAIVKCIQEGQGDLSQSCANVLILLRSIRNSLDRNDQPKLDIQ